jgi:hypothetical protein
MSKNKVNNGDMSGQVAYRNTFVNNNDTAWGEHSGDLYVVYSYGYHFPMYVYDYRLEQWFGNSDKYSSTTSRHQSYARPRGEDIKYLDTSMMKLVINAGGYNQTILGRIAA